MDSIARLDRIVRDWLDDPDTTIVCGRWTDGSVGELLPRGRARLSVAKHEGRFAGLRDLWIEGEEHHLHVDLGSFDRVAYTVVPSVCFGWRPSLELRFERASQPTGLAFATSSPYAVDRLRTPLAERYLRRLLHHRDEHPGLVEFVAQPAPQRTRANEATYRELAGLLWQLGARADAPPFDEHDPAGSLTRVYQEIRA
jgi:hypothetical protein